MMGAVVELAPHRRARRINQVSAFDHHDPRRWETYEQRKSQIAAVCKGPADYERMLTELAREMGL